MRLAAASESRVAFAYLLCCRSPQPAMRSRRRRRPRHLLPAAFPQMPPGSEGALPYFKSNHVGDLVSLSWRRRAVHAADVSGRPASAR